MLNRKRVWLLTVVPVLGIAAGLVYVFVLFLGSRPSSRTEEFGPIDCVDFSPDGRQILFGHSDHHVGKVRLWDIESGQVLSSFGNSPGAVHRATFSPDGQQLASGGRDSPIKIWRVDRSETMDELRHLHSKEYGNFAFAPNGKMMISSSLTSAR